MRFTSGGSLCKEPGVPEPPGVPIPGVIPGVVMLLDACYRSLDEICLYFGIYTRSVRRCSGLHRTRVCTQRSAAHRQKGGSTLAVYASLEGQYMQSLEKTIQSKLRAFSGLCGRASERVPLLGTYESDTWRKAKHTSISPRRSLATFAINGGLVWPVIHQS